MANKNRVLFLLQILQEQSDEGHPLTTTDIKKAFQAEGCPATAQTIRSDLRTLRESGYEIISTVRNGVPTAYAFKGRTFEFPELQILVDAVSSSQFITHSKSEKLIQKLSSMSGPSHRGELQPGIFVSEQIKAPNSQIFNIVQKIKEGIREDRKISFKSFAGAGPVVHTRNVTSLEDTVLKIMAVDAILDKRGGTDGGPDEIVV